MTTFARRLWILFLILLGTALFPIGGWMLWIVAALFVRKSSTVIIQK